MNLHEFYIGKAFDAYEYFGAHITKDGVLFRVYAPCAEKIELIGEFNDWDGSEDEMIQDAQSGVFECVQEDAEPGTSIEFIRRMGLYLTVLIRIVLVHRCGQIPHQLL